MAGMIKTKIEQLRQEPEHVRLRAATIMTVVSGGAVVLLWATVLLPLQLKFANPDAKNDDARQQAVIQTSLAPSAGVVSGIRAYENDAVGNPGAQSAAGLLFTEPTASPSLLDLTPVQGDLNTLPIGQ